MELKSDQIQSIQFSMYNKMNENIQKTDFT